MTKSFYKTAKIAEFETTIIFYNNKIERIGSAENLNIFYYNLSFYFIASEKNDIVFYRSLSFLLSLGEYSIVGV